VFGRAVFDQNENNLFSVKSIDVLNNISEGISINFKYYVEFEVIKAVTATDVIYFDINLLMFPKNLYRRTRIRRRQIALERRQISIKLISITTQQTVILQMKNCYRIQIDALQRDNIRIT